MRDEFVAQILNYRKARIGEGEFFRLVIEVMSGFSVLEFFLIRSMFEIKKSGVRNQGVIHFRHDKEAGRGPAKTHSISSFITTATLSQRVSNTKEQTGMQNCRHCGMPVKNS